MTLHPYTPNQSPCQVSTSHTLQFWIYSLDMIFKLKVTMARSNQGQIMTLNTLPQRTPNHCRYQVLTFYILWFLKYGLVKLFPTIHPPIQTPWMKTITTQSLNKYIKYSVLLSILCRNDTCSMVWYMH